jgi:hypothetical protein
MQNEIFNTVTLQGFLQLSKQLMQATAKIPAG